MESNFFLVINERYRKKLERKKKLFLFVEITVTTANHLTLNVCESQQDESIKESFKREINFSSFKNSDSIRFYFFVLKWIIWFYSNRIC